MKVISNVSREEGVWRWLNWENKVEELEESLTEFVVCRVVLYSKGPPIDAQYPTKAVLTSARGGN